jgi:hypothetical protein
VATARALAAAQARSLARARYVAPEVSREAAARIARMLWQLADDDRNDHKAVVADGSPERATRRSQLLSVTRWTRLVPGGLAAVEVRDFAGGPGIHSDSPAGMLECQ